MAIKNSSKTGKRLGGHNMGIGKRAGDHTLLPARLELHVPPGGFTRHEVQRLLVMFACVTRPRPIPYALRLVFDEPEDGTGDASEKKD